MSRDRQAKFRWRRIGYPILLLVLLGVGFWAWRMWLGRFDLVICGGRVFDGERWLRHNACIGVRDGRIARIGFLYGAEAKRSLWVWGSAVTPGFIETHAHVESNLAVDRPFRASNFVRMGVTTLITGNCGTSRRDIGALLDTIARTGTQVNFATFVGHNSIREAVMGMASRRAEPSEVEAMRKLVERAMADGALGFSSGLAYAPGSFADESEVIALTRAAALSGGMYVTHLRDEGAGGEAALEEALQIAAAAGAPLHISHFKIASEALWGSAPLRLQRLDQARKAGLRVTLDLYGYTASSTSLDILLPPELRGAHYRRQPRSTVIREMLAQLQSDGFRDYGFARIAYYRDHSLEGLNVPQAAERLLGRGSSLRDQTEAILRMLDHGGAQMIYFSMNERDVETILRDPWSSIGSDSSVRSADARFAHPRGAGNFARILAHYAREEHVITLDEALRKMTSLPADTFGFTGRGRLREGFAADLVIFDPGAIQDKATYDQPLDPPSGIRYVFVNGAAALENGSLTRLNSGQVLRRKALAGGQPH